LSGAMTKILVLGGTGTVGRRVARILRENGRDVRTAARSSGFDLDDRSTWAAALDGVTSAYVLKPDLRAGDERLPAFVSEAVAAGVGRLVMLSAPGTDLYESHPLRSSEQAVRGSGVEWTVLRPGWFAQNFSESFWRPAVMEGTLALPTGDGGAPFIDADDIADVAVAALTDGRHNGQIYELTGPRVVSFGEAAELIGKASGRSVRYVDIDPGEFVERQVEAGVPREAAEYMTRLYVGLRDIESVELTDGVQRALGRPPRSFEEFVTKAADEGHWN
jgi:uncharacterized protein YbjT (DUF2867 family)